MRKIFLLPLAIVAAACGTPEPDPAAPAVTKRELTLQVLPSSPRAEVALPVEVGRPIQQHPARRTSKPRPTPPLLEPVIVPVHYEPLPIIPITLSPVVESPPPTSEPADEHELLPGKTVTVIPSSSGSSMSADPGGDAPPTAASQD